MKGKFRYLIFVFIVLSFISSPLVQARESKKAASSQRVKKENNSLAIPTLKEDMSLPRSRWDIGRLFDRVLEKLPKFLDGLPKNIKKVSIVRLEGDEHIYINTTSLLYKMQKVIIDHRKFKVIECRECNNMKVFVEEDSLILARTVETNEQFQKLGKKLGIDAYLQGMVMINEKSGQLQLNLQIVRVKDGVILKADVIDSHFVNEMSGKKLKAAMAVDAYQKRLKPAPLDVEKYYHQILEEVNPFLKNIPSNIKTVTVSRFKGDNKHYVDIERLRYLFQNALINRSNLLFVECPQCGIQKYYVNKGMLVLSASKENEQRYQDLGQRLGFQAYIEASIFIDERRKTIELDLKLIRAKNNIIIKTGVFSAPNAEQIAERDKQLKVKRKEFVEKSMRSAEKKAKKTEERRLAEERKTLADAKAKELESGEAFLTFVPVMGFKTTGLVEKNNIYNSETVNTFMGIGYRYVIYTFWENIQIGVDLEYYMAMPDKGEESLATSLVLIEPILRYKVPVNVFGFQCLAAYAGIYGYGIASSGGQAQLSVIKFGGSLFVTKGFSVGVDVFMAGSTKIDTGETDDNNAAIENKFEGTGVGINMRFLFDD